MANFTKMQILLYLDSWQERLKAENGAAEPVEQEITTLGGLQNVLPMKNMLRPK